MTKSVKRKMEERKLETQISAYVNSISTELFLTTDQAAKALSTSRKNLGASNEYGLRPIKNRGRSYQYLKPDVIRAVVNQTLESL